MLIAAIGDSLTYGFPYSPQQSWLEIAGKNLGVDTLNKGRCGETTGEMLYRFCTDVSVHSPDIVIIMGGSNDAFAGIIAAEVSENIRLMVERAIECDIRPVVGIPIPCNYAQEEEFMQEYRGHIIAYCQAKGIPMIDFYKPLLAVTGGLRTDYQVDGVHPNIQGYYIMSEAAIPVLKRMIEPKQSE